ncbi:uncharacterized protein LOC134240292 [Saccostrea cucullata]|uniref:uncharacterized protein LOC134240292 n=1 Tax=Saccostrea cuccullata TaxID=36930 RepID=UPI002ED0E434
MVDKHIATESDSTSLNFSVPVSDLSLHLLPRYQYGTYDFVNCSANTMKPATTTLSLEVCDADSTFIPFEMYNTSFVVYNETGLKNENCSQQILLNYQVLFNSQMNVSLRCSFHDSFKNTTLPTSCRIPEISTALVVGVMDPPSHDIMIENKTELFCYFNVSSFEWDAVLLDFQNESSISRRIVRLTNGSRDWHEGQINATLREDSSFVNVTVVLDFATPKDACSLSGIYTCSIEMVDKHIATESDSTSLNFSVPVSDLSLHLLPRYQYGTYDFVNCSANTMEPSTTTLSLDICNSDSTFTPIQKFVDTTSLNETSLKNENCTYKLMLSHLIYFNNQTGVSFRCSVKNSNLNATMESNCTTITVVPQLVTAEMSPTVFAKLGTVTEMICSIQTKGLAWTSASIRRHNKTASTVILTIHNDSRVESRDSKINGTGNIGVGFVNITVLIDTSSDSEICELNKNYSCDIDIIDSSIQTIAANSSFMIQAQLSAINISTESSYLSGSNSTIDCTVDHGDIRDTNVFLEVCQNGSFENLEATELVTRDVLKLDNDTDVSCSNKTLFRFHILMMDSRNGSSFRCHGKDDLYNISLPTRCVSISVTQVKAIVEPAKIYGELNSTVSFQCRIPLSRSYFSAFQLLNKSSHPILAINFDNYTIQPQNDRVFAVYTSDQFDEYRAVNFTFDLRSGDDVCNIAGVYICRVTSFNESLLLPGENESQLAIAASPSEITLEIKDSYPEKEINQTINCTALLNPDTTTLALVRLSNESYTIVPKNITKTSIQPTRTDDCRHLVKLIVSTTFDRFNQSTVACLAKDVVFGDFFSVNKTIFIVKNDNP